MEPTQPSFFQKHKTLIIVAVVLVVIALWFGGKYNSFVRQNEAINGQWAQVENQFQRRFDLIPNLVNTVKGITRQEQEVFGEIADARTRYAGAATVDEKARAAGQVESALGRLLVITENYPVLQSSKSFQDLMTSLEGTENRISVERMRFNEMVRDLNANVKIFPNSIIAAIFGVKERAYFEVAEEANTAPTVDFGGASGTVPVGSPTPENPAAY